MNQRVCQGRNRAERNLSRSEQKSYLKAVQCLRRKQPQTDKSDMPGVTNRFEDFLGDHILQTGPNHFTGYFYPWHRLLIAMYEREIRKCGFKGAQPYWDWSIDAVSAETMVSSPVFDTEYGFGSNGPWVPGTQESPDSDVFVTAENFPFDLSSRTGGGCLTDGPFANMTIHMGPGYNMSYNPWCVRRDFVPAEFLRNANKEVVDDNMAKENFNLFQQSSEFTLHVAGHHGIGGLYGTLTDIYASPGDPLFFLHHANLDRVWWSWQSKNLTERLSDISGPLEPNDWANEKSRNVTLDDEVHFGTTVKTTVAIRDVMDVEGDFLCYTYADLY
ncbi:hypothetical protein CEP53_015221 [Fusarium sp. AF-6]|nr:hypothetical protein CEP53_015221 [Fusarium sp. AF-6]